MHRTVQRVDQQRYRQLSADPVKLARWSYPGSRAPRPSPHDGGEHDCPGTYPPGPGQSLFVGATVGPVQLPRGATGFWSASATPPAPVDVRTFKSLGHSVGRVVSFQPAGVTPNFHLLTLRLPAGDLGVICHELLPLIAFVTVPLVDCSPTFVSRPDLAPFFPGFEALTADALATPASRADLSLLAVAEHRQILYWRPATVGETLFNYWD
jgi:hypothetical protein